MKLICHDRTGMDESFEQPIMHLCAPGRVLVCPACAHMISLHGLSSSEVVLTYFFHQIIHFVAWMMMKLNPFKVT